MSNTKPLTGTFFAIQGCDLTILICSRDGESAAGVIEEHDFSRSEYAVRNNKLHEVVFGYRRPAGSNNVDIGVWQPQYFREVREARIHARYNGNFGSWRSPELWVVSLRIIAVFFQCAVDNTHRWAADCVAVAKGSGHQERVCGFNRYGHYFRHLRHRN
jgi:hypothetical protein